jgi:hypothetical protein
LFSPAWQQPCANLSFYGTVLGDTQIHVLALDNIKGIIIYISVFKRVVTSFMSKTKVKFQVKILEHIAFIILNLTFGRFLDGRILKSFRSQGTEGGYTLLYFPNTLNHEILFVLYFRSYCYKIDWFSLNNLPLCLHKPFLSIYIESPF